LLLSVPGMEAAGGTFEMKEGSIQMETSKVMMEV
jgi:hypothetical protein